MPDVMIDLKVRVKPTKMGELVVLLHKAPFVEIHGYDVVGQDGETQLLIATRGGSKPGVRGVYRPKLMAQLAVAPATARDLIAIIPGSKRSSIYNHLYALKEQGRVKMAPDGVWSLTNSETARSNAESVSRAKSSSKKSGRLMVLEYLAENEPASSNAIKTALKANPKTTARIYSALHQLKKAKVIEQSPDGRYTRSSHEEA